ncbi:MAG: hypothetical protein ACOYI9_01295 [Candidatus Hydrogenedentales bacterium]|jgi:hypothetical protein
MTKKWCLGLLVVVMIIGFSGCRIPIIDPPVVGTWQIVSDNPLGTHLLTFNRDNSGVEKTIIGDRITFTTEFTWSYNRWDQILKKGSISYQVDFNIWRNHAILYSVDNHRKLMELELVSTPPLL